MANNKEIAQVIGKSIIKRFFDYYEDVSLDDEDEFFPVLKIIILEVAHSFNNKVQAMEVEKELKEYSKQLYISLWLLHAEEDEKKIDIEYERNKAISEFEEIYRKV